MLKDDPTYAAVDSQMKRLKAGDVVTNLSGLFGATDDRIVVLTKEGKWMVMSKRGTKDRLDYDVDGNGPYRWDSESMSLQDTNKLQHPHIGRCSTVLTAAGILETNLPDSGQQNAKVFQLNRGIK